MHWDEVNFFLKIYIKKKKSRATGSAPFLIPSVRSPKSKNLRYSFLPRAPNFSMADKFIPTWFITMKVPKVSRSSGCLSNPRSGQRKFENVEALKSMHRGWIDPLFYTKVSTARKKIDKIYQSANL